MNKRTTLLFVLAAMMMATQGAERQMAEADRYIVQQTVKVSGRVLDQNGEPVAGASVVERGYKTNGITTDNDGRFTLSVHSANAQLTVSFIGYNTTTATVQNGRADVVLTERDNDLDERLKFALAAKK